MTDRTLSKDSSIVTGLRREYFVDQSVFDQESKLIFDKSWLCVTHVDLLQKNSVNVLDVGSYSVLLVCDELGAVHAFHNVCRHRGTQLCSEKKNSVQSIQCPYHAWTYGLNGELIGAPNMADQDAFDRSQYGLGKVHVITWNGLVFLNLDERPTSFDAFIKPLASRMSHWDFADLKFAASRQYEVSANWKLIFQNYSECYHCPTVHPTLNRLTPFRSASNDLEEGAILGGPMILEDEFETVSSDGKFVAAPFDLDEERSRLVYYYTVFPSMGFSPHPDYLMIHLLHRVDCLNARVECLFFTRNGDNSRIEKAVQMWDQVNREDWQVCELTQKGAASPAFQPGPYSTLETMLAAFDRHYLQCMEDSGGQNDRKAE